jgi:hypothetical protein
MKEPFIDLDSIVTGGAKFQFKGKVYSLKAIDAQTFMTFNNDWADLQMMIQKEVIGQDESMNILVRLIRAVCFDLPENLIRNEMTIAQIGALINLIVRTVTGEAQQDDKKKVLREPNLSQP